MISLEEQLSSLSNEKLKDVVKNYRQYGYSESLRQTAIDLLKERGISIHDLELTGNLHNRNYDQAAAFYKSFSQYSMIALLLYTIVVIITFLLPLIITDLESVKAYLSLKSIITIVYVIFLALAFLSQYKFYRILKQDYGTEGVFVYLFLGMPFYLLMYFYFRNQMKEKMKEVR